MARGGQRRRHGYCFSRNASFMRTVFCEYIVYFFCAFFCDFLLFLLIVSPFFGILAGRQRAPEVAGRMHAGAAVLALPSPRALLFRQALVLLDLKLAGLVGESSAHVADAQPRGVFYVLGRGAGPVMRHVWTLTCNRETRPRAGINYGLSCHVPLMVRGDS